MSSRNPWLLTASLMGAMAVVMGAYHAHGLEKTLVKRNLSSEDVAKRIDQCGVAVRYQMTQALALLAIGLSGMTRPSRLLSGAATLMLIGACLFCGGLYSGVFLGKLLHWSVVPSGGLIMTAGWLTLGVTAVPRRKTRACRARAG